MNNYFGTGRLVRDIEISNTSTGLAYTNFSIAIARPSKSEKDKKTDFIRCTAFGKTALFAKKWLVKGGRLTVIGSLQSGSYEREDGNTVYTLDVIVDKIEPIDWKPKEEGTAISVTEQKDTALVPAEEEAPPSMDNPIETSGEELPEEEW